MASIKRVLKELALTISYVTCFPVYKLDFDESDQSLSGLAKYLPAAGCVVGVALNLVLLICYFLHPSHTVIAAALVVCWFAFTSGLHLDGLMDTADGIFSHKNVDRILEIMRDSRVGNFGVLVGVSVLLLKFAALSTLSRQPLYLIACLLVVPAWARWAEVFAIGKYDYLRAEGLGKVWHDTTNYPTDLYKATCLPLFLTACAASLGLWRILAVALVSIAFGILAARWFAKRLGGHTGDTYGAVVELTECAALLAATFTIRL